jgi:hypothetical protein
MRILRIVDQTIPRPASAARTSGARSRSGRSELLRTSTSTVLFSVVTGSRKIESVILVWTSSVRLPIAVVVAAHAGSASKSARAGRRRGQNTVITSIPIKTTSDGDLLPPP